MDLDFPSISTSLTDDSTKLFKKQKLKFGSFNTMGLFPELHRAIKFSNYKNPTPIQRKTIPVVMAGEDVVAMARTGSGKTAAFLIPLIQRLKSHSPQMGFRGLILSPTRELSIQTMKFLHQLIKYTDLRACLLVGGDEIDTQFAQLAMNPDIIVATPGRLAHHLTGGDLSVLKVEYIVYDEADRMLEMGFAEQLKILHKELAKNTTTIQRVFMSATLPAELKRFVVQLGIQNPHLIKLDAEMRVNDAVTCHFFFSRTADKPGAFLALLNDVIYPNSVAKLSLAKPSEHHTQLTIVFAATRHHAEYLTLLVRTVGYAASCIYGSMDQTARKINLANFRNGTVPMLIVTDLAARGLDIPLLDNVINYDFPAAPKLFVHRVGRAGRMGRLGNAYSLLSPDEEPYLMEWFMFAGQEAVFDQQDVQAKKEKKSKKEESKQDQDIEDGDEEADEEGDEEGADEGEYEEYNSEDEDKPSKTESVDAKKTLYGSVPQHMVDSHLETVHQAQKQVPELATAWHILKNASERYAANREKASNEAAKRAKQIPRPLPIHPVFLALLPQGGEERDTKIEELMSQERTSALAALSGFRPPQTIFEIDVSKKNKIRKNSSLVLPQSAAQSAAQMDNLKDKNRSALEAMANKRRHHQDIITKRKELAEKEKQKKLQLEDDEEAEDQDEIQVENDDEELPIRPSKKNKSFKDGDFYMELTPTNLHANHGYSLSLGSSDGVEVMGDEEDSLKRKKMVQKWDRRKKKYVWTQNGFDPNDSDRNKKIKNESGKLVKMEKGVLFNEWKERTNLSVPKVGEREDSKLISQFKSDPNTYKKKFRYNKGNEDSKSGHVTKSKEEILKGRKKQTKREDYLKFKRTGKGKEKSDSKKTFRKGAPENRSGKPGGMWKGGKSGGKSGGKRKR
eukprot:TRINITY_DN2652_c4_g1_i1.p1 TRINITY_DN2652_c4_g1~~TRINITY_DN2652_c4_g1_i1.p1  ORF type:complete len:905 (-),score=332.81 TRINITY_DN2652_c4_g1_i1:85-2799(-)